MKKTSYNSPFLKISISFIESLFYNHCLVFFQNKFYAFSSLKILLCLIPSLITPPHPSFNEFRHNTNVMDPAIVLISSCPFCILEHWPLISLTVLHHLFQVGELHRVCSINRDRVMLWLVPDRGDVKPYQSYGLHLSGRVQKNIAQGNNGKRICIQELICHRNWVLSSQTNKILPMFHCTSIYESYCTI